MACTAHGAAWILVALVMPGCYLAHERERLPDAAASACVGDPVDAAVVRMRAAPPASDAVTFEIESRATFPMETGGIDSFNRLVRSSRGWGAASSDRFFSLDPSGMPGASLAGLTRAGGLAFGHDRFALIARTPDQGTQLRFLDQNATEVSSPFMVRMDLLDGDSRRLDVAWLESRGAFVVASTQPARSDRIDITMVDENGASLERLTVVAPSDVVGVHIAAGPRRALVILQQPTHILQGVLLGGQPVSVLAGPFDLLVNDGRGNAAPTVFAYDQDHFLVAGFDGHEVRVSTVDAADCGRMPVQPRVIAPSTNLVQMAGIATAPERGFYAVCFTDGSTTRVQAVGEDGTPWGRPFDTMIDDADTACGWDGEHVLVVSGRDSVRLRPTFL